MSVSNYFVIMLNKQKYKLIVNSVALTIMNIVGSI